MSGNTIIGLPGAPEVYAGSTKVLATKGSGKAPDVYAGVASVVAFLGPKRWRPPVFYFSSMMAVDAEARPTTRHSPRTRLLSVLAWHGRRHGSLGHRNRRRGTRRRRGQ